MHGSASNGATAHELTVVRLLQNPLGQEAPQGQRGDMVRISDGRTRLYRLPSEFDIATTAYLRWMLARQPGSSTGRLWRRADSARSSRRAG